MPPPHAATAAHAWAAHRPAPSAFARVPIDESSNLNQLAAAAGVVNVLEVAGGGVGGGGVAAPRQLMVDVLALLLDHTWTHTDRQPGAPAPAPLCQWQAPARCLANAPAPAQRAGAQGALGGPVQSTGAAVPSPVAELGSALAGIVSAYWSHATHELQLELSRGLARNASLHAALAFAQAEGRGLGESNESLRLDLAAQQRLVRVAQGQLDTTVAELGATRAELFHLRAELGQARTQLGQTRTELEAARTEHGATLAKATATWNVLCRARHEIAGNLEKLSAAVANEERVKAERQSMLTNAAQCAARAEDAARGLVAARAETQSLRSELAAEVARGAARAAVAAGELRALQQRIAGALAEAAQGALRDELAARAAAAKATAAAQAAAAEDLAAARAVVRSLRSELAAGAQAAAAKEGERAAAAEDLAAASAVVRSLRSELAAGAQAAAAKEGEEAAAAEDLAAARAVVRSLHSELAAGAQAAAAKGKEEAAAAKALAAARAVVRSLRSELAARAPAAVAKGGEQAAADEARRSDGVHRGVKRPRSPGQGCDLPPDPLQRTRRPVPAAWAGNRGGRAEWHPPVGCHCGKEGRGGRPAGHRSLGPRHRQRAAGGTGERARGPGGRTRWRHRRSPGPAVGIGNRGCPPSLLQGAKSLQEVPPSGWVLCRGAPGGGTHDTPACAELAARWTLLRSMRVLSSLRSMRVLSSLRSTRVLSSLRPGLRCGRCLKKGV